MDLALRIRSRMNNCRLTRSYETVSSDISWTGQAIHVKPIHYFAGFLMTIPLIVCLARRNGRRREESKGGEKNERRKENFHVKPNQKITFFPHFLSSSPLSISLLSSHFFQPNMALSSYTDKLNIFYFLGFVGIWRWYVDLCSLYRTSITCWCLFFNFYFTRWNMWAGCK